MSLKFFFFFLFSIAIIGCKDNRNPNDYLKKVLSNLEKIESATYYTIHESWLPGDTIPYAVYHRFYKEYNNPMDSTIGASFVWFNADDTTQLMSYYDGDIHAYVDHKNKEIKIDDFTLDSLPYRPLSPPFFNYTKSIINYILETKDSIMLLSEILDDSYYFKLIINEDKQVEFFGKAYYMSYNPLKSDENTSIYELWINKLNDLPYKYRRDMSYNANVRACSEVKINTLSIKDFNTHNFFPTDYSVRKKGEKSGMVLKTDLIGKIAPDWALNDANGQTVSLADFKSKVLIINFTGIGCGPCLVSIPFLKKLRNNYKVEDVEVVAIECWKRPSHAIHYYTDKNNLNYQLLSATDQIVENYLNGNRGVPHFFILDKQRVIKKVISGYEEEITDKEITETITDLFRN